MNSDISICDVNDEKDAIRYERIKAHLITRAAENALFIISANSISRFQTAPTCLIDPDGKVLGIAPQQEEHLLTFEFEKEGSNFERDGRIRHSKELVGI